MSRVSKLKKYSRVEAGALYSVTLAIIGGRLYQLRGIPFGSPDDTFMAATAWVHGGITAAAVEQAESQGRFYQFIFTFLTQLPSNLLPVKLLWLVVAAQILLLAVSIYLGSKAVFENPRLRAITVMFFFLFYDFRGAYNSATSFPLWFSFCISSFLISIWLLHNNSKQEGEKYNLYKRLITLFLCFFSTLGYESFLYFPLIYLCIAYMLSLKGLRINPNIEFFKNTSQKIKIEILGVFIFYFFYIFIYLDFMTRNPTNYPGVKISLTGAFSIFETIFKMSLGGYGYAYHILRLDLSNFLKSNFLYLVIFLLILLFLFRFIKKSVVHKQTILVTLIGLSVFLPNILYAFTDRYREEAQNSIPLYLGALPSAICLSIMVTYSLGRIVNKDGIYKLIAFATILVLTVVATANSRNLTEYSDNMRLRNIAWELSDGLIKSLPSNYFGAKILSPDLYKEINSPESYKYWSYYFSKQVGKRIEFTNSSDVGIKLDTIRIIGNSQVKCLLFFNYNNLGSSFKLKKVVCNSNLNAIIEIPSNSDIHLNTLKREGNIYDSGEIDLLVVNPADVSFNHGTFSATNNI